MSEDKKTCMDCKKKITEGVASTNGNARCFQCQENQRDRFLEDNDLELVDKEALNYVDSRTPEQREADKKIEDSMVITTTAPSEEEMAKPTKEEWAKIEEESKKERDEAIQKVLERKVELSGKYVKPHNKVSRKVKASDLKRVIKDATFMHEMCLVGRGDYTTAYAIAHPQIDEKDPLAFYVTIEGHIIINPVIVRYTHQFIDKKEGCMSYPEEPMRICLRFNKVTMTYQTLTQKEKDGKPVGKPTLSAEVTTEYTGTHSQVVQHELAHLLGHNIYDEDHTATHSVEKKFLDTKPFTT